MLRRLLLLRHGETGLAGPTGQVDRPPTAAAVAAWPRVRAALHQRLADQSPTVVATSLVRSRAPACDLAATWDQEPVIDDRLLEQDFGHWSGRSWNAIGDQPGFFADPVTATPPGGESYAGCAARAVAWLQQSLPEADHPLVVIAHAGSLRAILGHLLALPLPRQLDLAWSPYGLSELDCYQDTGALRGVLRGHNQVLGREAQGPASG